MPKSINRVTFLGLLGKEPEIRTTPNGMNNATLNIATTESYKDKSGQWQEVTDWHRVIFWDKKAEICQKYLNKGSKVMIEGKLKTRSYEKNGVTTYITEVIGSDLYLLDSIAKDFVQNKESEKENIDDDVPF